MNLQQFIQNERNIAFRDMSQPLAMDMQSRLCDLGILDPVINGSESVVFKMIAKGDGVAGKNTAIALKEFCRKAAIPFVGDTFSVQQAQALQQASGHDFYPLQLDFAAADDRPTRLAKHVLRYMMRHQYWIARSPLMYNIVYVEGMDADDSLNADTFDHWNDRRMVIRIAEDGRPEMLVNDQCTTEPGRHYTHNPMQGTSGVARIGFGQYKAWRYDIHLKGRKGAHPALVQRGRLKVHRDRDKNGFRTNDFIDMGDSFRINQHTALSTHAPDDVDRYSAGCLVGRRYAWHASFLDIVRQDCRFVDNDAYMFMSTVIAGDDLMK